MQTSCIRHGNEICGFGGDHLHIIWNETSEPAQTIVVQPIPALPDGSSSAADRRIDASDPGNCHF